MTYLQWRGDLSIDEAPLNEIDSLILSELVYLKFEGIVPPVSKTGEITIAKAAKQYHDKNLKDIPELEYHPRETMMQVMAQSRRFSHMTLTNYATVLDEEEIHQFAALQVNLKKNHVYIAYRGTDKTLTGWRENFYMSFQMPICAQQSAVDYLNKIATGFFTKYWIGGHSKGGNLALYAGMSCDSRIQKKIQRIDTFDSPGFISDLSKEKPYRQIADKVHAYVPPATVVGRLLEPPKDYVVVESDEYGLLQHNAFLWHVSGSKFVTAKDRTSFSYSAENAIRGAVGQLTMQERKDLVDGFFQVLEDAGITRFSDFATMDAKGVLSLIRAMTSVPSKNKALIIRVIQLLKESN